MEDIQKNIVALLHSAVDRLRETKLFEEQAVLLQQLAEQVYQPCVVAVVGPVKAGKSTFINAFLNEDLAKVGTVETTATINYFRYGHIASDRPIRCFWRGGQVDYVDLAFVNSLQGNDVEMLRRADGIDHLEYYVPNHPLEQVILVDTPGTGAAVDDHQDRTAEFIHLERQLRARHNQETQQIGSKADAVIYLIDAIARSSDQDFLEEFQQVTQGQSQAFNAIGVMAKIDLYPEVMERRAELAAKIANQLKDSLNTVVPVSAGLRRAMDRLLKDDMIGLKQLIDAVRCIPPKRLKKFLEDAEFYLESDPPDCPVTPDQRRKLLGEMDWTVFTTIARVVADPTLDIHGMIDDLNALAGFDQLNEVLEQHFFKRSRVLRCHRILVDAQQLLNTLKFKRLPELRKRDRAEKMRQERLLAFIRQAHGNPAVAKELEALVLEHLSWSVEQLEVLVEELERDVESIFYQLKRYSADFEMLRLILEHENLFSRAELDELQALLGLYGLEIEKRLSPGRHSVEYVSKRQRAWRQVMLLDVNPLRRDVAQQVGSRYGLLLEE